MHQYLHFAEQAHQINSNFKLGQYEIQLLDLVAKAHFLGRPIFIGDLIYQREIACHTTLHTAFRGLLNKNLLITRQHEADARSKSVTLTELALERYKKLQYEMKKSLALHSARL